MQEREMALGGSWLHRLFLLRQLVEAHIDRAFDDAPWPLSFRIVFYNEVDAGLGDVAFMTKLLTLVANSPGSPELVLVSTGIDKQRKFALPDSVRVVPVDEAPGHPWVQGCNLVVSAPGIFDHCRSRDSVMRTLGLPPATPFLYLAEYGSIRQLRDDTFKPLMADIEAARDAWIEELATSKGFEPDDAGFRGKSGEVVAIDAAGQPVQIGSLVDFFLNVGAENNPLAPWMSQPYLSARSCGLEPGELGVHIDLDTHATALQVASAEKCRAEIASEIENSDVRAVVCDAIERGRRIFMGYAHSGHRVFHDLLSASYEGDDSDAVLVIPDARPASRILAEDFPPLLLERMVRRGVGQIEVTGRASAAEGEIETVQNQFGSGRLWQVVSIYPLTHADMKRLMLVSEPPTMVSGDQSFSDAVSALKAIAVIEPVYCQTWHLDAVCDLAARLHGQVGAMLKAGLTFEWQPQHMDEVLQYSKEPGFWHRAVELSKAIVAFHDVNRPILAAIRRAAWVSDREGDSAIAQWLGSEIRACLDRVRSTMGGAWRPDQLGPPPVAPDMIRARYMRPEAHPA
jgi:hypothetical protein